MSPRRVAGALVAAAKAAGDAAAPGVCSCPSGSGSLHWPCPVHPPEDAGATGQTASDEWRVGEFWSSANPGKKVLMLACGIDIENFGRHKDFIRWVGASLPVEPAASATPSGDLMLERHYVRNGLRDAHLAGQKAGRLVGKEGSDRATEYADTIVAEWGKQS